MDMQKTTILCKYVAHTYCLANFTYVEKYVKELLMHMLTTYIHHGLPWQESQRLHSTHGRQPQICVCSKYICKCIHNVIICIWTCFESKSFAVFSISKKICDGCKDNSKILDFVSLTNPYCPPDFWDLTGYHILSFSFKFGWPTIAMKHSEFSDEFSAVPSLFQNDSIKNKLQIYL